MAGGKLTIQKRVKGSTLLEVVVSMVIIILVFGIAMMIYANITRSALSAKKIRAQAIMQQALLHLEESDQKGNANFKVGDITIQQIVNSYKDDPDLTEVSLTVYDDNHTEILETHQIIITKSND
jgi:Tfp pilus assembly protein PilE